jgi:hypothetical protein
MPLLSSRKLRAGFVLADASNRAAASDQEAATAAAGTDSAGNTQQEELPLEVLGQRVEVTSRQTTDVAVRFAFHTS